MKSPSHTDQENYGGAVLVGRPDSGCSQELVVMNSNFSRCSVDGTNGAGGALAVFDTSASLEDCLINHIEGTAVLFRSSKANGAHKISVSGPSTVSRLFVIHHSTDIKSDLVVDSKRGKFVPSAGAQYSQQVSLRLCVDLTPLFPIRCLCR